MAYIYPKDPNKKNLVPYDHRHTCTCTCDRKVPVERKVQPMVLDSSDGLLNKIGLTFRGPLDGHRTPIGYWTNTLKTKKSCENKKCFDVPGKEQLRTIRCGVYSYAMKGQSLSNGQRCSTDRQHFTIRLQKSFTAWEGQHHRNKPDVTGSSAASRWGHLSAWHHYIKFNILLAWGPQFITAA